MGAIDETRKVLQDFSTPEIREIKARLDALEKRMDERFDTVNKRMDERFDAADRLAHQRHDAVMVGIQTLANYNEVKDRLTKLEAAREIVHQ